MADFVFDKKLWRWLSRSDQRKEIQALIHEEEEEEDEANGSEKATWGAGARYQPPKDSEPFRLFLGWATWVGWGKHGLRG